MNKKSAYPLLLSCLVTCALAADPPPAPANSAAPASESIPISYVGTGTRFGIGYDSKTKLRGDLYQIFNEDSSSAWIGEGWVTDQAGGLQLSYHWLPESGLKDPGAFVRKAFGAIDQNMDHDRKVTLGAGMESAAWFGNAYVSHGITDRRNLSDITTSSTTTVSGVQDGRPYLQDITTATRVEVFERAYDWGVGIRGGHYYDAPALRLTLGADYEWGNSSAHQTSISFNAEKFFPGTPHSLVLYAEGLRKSGDFEVEHSDHRVGVIYRYELGGKSFRPVQETRTVPVEVPATVASTEATPAEPAKPRIEKRMVKTTASLQSDAFFDFDRATLRPDAKKAMDELVAKLRQSGFEGNIHVVGHTCNIGTAAYNQKLSERRAATVKRYLVDSGAVKAEQVVAEGMGLREPRYPNNAEGRPKNRRVDVEFVTFETHEETVTLPPEPAAAPKPAPAAKPAIEYRREVIDTEPAWLRRALHNTAQHKQTVDVYRQQETSTTVTQGERRFINRPPVAQNDAYTVNQNSSNNLLDVLANDSDPDGDALTIASVTAPAHGAAVISGGKVSYTPTAGYVGADSFTYSVTDSKGASGTATVTITVSQLNRAPVANNDAFTLPQDAPATAFDVLANDSDPDGDALTITTVSTPAHGTASIAGNKVSYKPVTGYSGTDSLTYTISDGKGGTATATVTFTITAANRAPVANGDSATVAQDAPATLIDVLANDSDPDGDALTLTSVTAPAHGTATISGNKVSYKPSAGYSGPDSLSYTISDGKGGTATAVVSITVTPAAPANRAPVANGDSATVAQDAPATLIDVLANDSDPDGDTLTITSVTAPAHGTASVSGNKVSYKPSAGYSGPDSLSYTISDGKGGTASAVVAITVTPVNHVPVANADSFSLPQNSGATLFDVLANDSDPDGDSLTIVSTSTPLHGTASISGGKVSYKPATDYSGPDSFSYTVSDGKGGTATALVSITVTPVVKNLAPTANDDFVFIYFNTAANVNVLANDTDPEGDTLTVTSFTQPTHGTVTRGSGQILVYTPNNNFVGIDSFSYTISDGHGNTASANVRVYVDP